MINIIYDTLMENTTNKQFDARKVEPPYHIDNNTGEILFKYGGNVFKLTLKVI